MFLTSYKILLINWFVTADPPNVLYEVAIWTEVEFSKYKLKAAKCRPPVILSDYIYSLSAESTRGRIDRWPNCLAAESYRGRTGPTPYAYFSRLFIRDDVTSHYLYSIYHVTDVYILTWRHCWNNTVLPQVTSSTPTGWPGAVFWLLGRLGLGTRLWVHMGLSVRLGSVFSLGWAS